LFDFKWSPLSSQIKFEFLGKYGEKNLVNHFEYHTCLTQKDQVFELIMRQSESMYKDCFDILPLTFVLNATDRTKCDPEL